MASSLFLERTFLYANYFLKVVDLHSIQTPFAFELYSRLKNEIKKSELKPEIEQIRHQLQGDHSTVLGEDYGTGSERSHRGRDISGIAKTGISTQKRCLIYQAIMRIFNPAISFELGTSLGVSTAYLASSSSAGKIHTFEGNAELSKIARRNFSELGLGKINMVEGNIDDTLPKILKEIESLDMCVIDANHRGRALMHYVDLLINKMDTTGLILVDDIRWSKDMYHAWKIIACRNEVTLSLEFMDFGLLLFKKNITKQHYVLSL